MRSQKVVVTGANGFIGTRLCSLLKTEGCRLVGLDMNAVPIVCDETFVGDLAVEGAWSKALVGADTVFHLAGKVHALSEVKGDDSGYFQINTEGTRNVLEAARQAGVKRFVLFSTIKAMSREGAGGRTTDDRGLTVGKGEHRTFNAELSTFKEGTTEDGGRMAERRKDELSTSNTQLPTLNSQNLQRPANGGLQPESGDQRSDVAVLRTFTEEDVIEPDTPYGKSKLEAEKLVLYGGYVPEPVVLRLCMVYGPGAKGNMQKMLQAVAKHRFPPLPEVNNKRSMVHVQDVVNAAILAAERPEAVCQTFIVSDGYSYSTRQLYELMVQALGRRPPKWSIPIPFLRVLGWAGDAIGKLRGKRFMFDSDALQKLIGSAWFSSNKIETMLGFKPEWNLEKALPEMVKEMRSAERQAPSAEREGRGA